MGHAFQISVTAPHQLLVHEPLEHPYLVVPLSAFGMGFGSQKFFQDTRYEIVVNPLKSLIARDTIRLRRLNWYGCP